MARLILGMSFGVGALIGLLWTGALLFALPQIATQPAAATSFEVPATVVARPLPASLAGETAHRAALTATRGDITWMNLRLKRGEAVMDLIARAGATREDAGQAAAALSRVFDGRTLQAGQRVELALTRASNGAARLGWLSLNPEPAKQVSIRRGADGFAAAAEELNLRPVTRHVSGRIEGSLYVSARGQGVPNATISEVTRLLAYAVDFQREIYAGDRFELTFTGWADAQGRIRRAGDLLHVRLTLADRDLAFWRFERDGVDRAGFFDAKGQSAARLLMKTPIDGARISSNFGTRRHPVLGYQRMHKGVDFAAPRGTPIFAAGNGVVERANRFGSFGNYIRIRHAENYKTAYAHLKGFARGIKAGSRVRQGQTIGYVGTTGRSTGPHLHYEVHHKGKAVNPMKLRNLGGEKLRAAELSAFRVQRAYITALGKVEPREVGLVQAPQDPSGVQAF